MTDAEIEKALAERDLKHTLHYIKRGGPLFIVKLLELVAQYGDSAMSFELDQLVELSNFQPSARQMAACPGLSREVLDAAAELRQALDQAKNLRKDEWAAYENLKRPLLSRLLDKIFG